MVRLLALWNYYYRQVCSFGEHWLMVRLLLALWNYYYRQVCSFGLPWLYLVSWSLNAFRPSRLSEPC
jgi:hypothetical protein